MTPVLSEYSDALGLTLAVWWKTLSKLLGMPHIVLKQWTGSLVLGGMVVFSRNWMNHLSQAGSGHASLAVLQVAFPKICRRNVCY